MKQIIVITILSILAFTGGCESANGDDAENYERRSANLFDLFDTSVQVIGYTKTEDEFDQYVEEIDNELKSYHQLYDRYNEYEDINNVKTINDKAGEEPVEVDKKIIDLLDFAKNWHEKTEGKVNVGAGRLVDKWNDVIETGDQDAWPSESDLNTASSSIDLDNVVIDQEESTVYLEDEEMNLDFGAIAKGFASEKVGQEMIEQGFTSGAIVSGGNWKMLGEPRAADRDEWVVAIQDPEHPYSSEEEGILERIYQNDGSVDTSGDYQRFTSIDGERIHHIIDPETKYPGKENRGVTVTGENAAITEYLTTELFLLSYESGEELIESLDGYEAYWVTDQEEIKKSSGMEKFIND